MYSNRDKIAKKGDAKPTDVEEEVAKILFELENAVPKEIVGDVKKLKLTEAKYHTQGDNKVLQITVPYPLHALVKAHYKDIVPFLETKFKVPVGIVAQRTILSKYGIIHNCPM